MKLVKKFGKRLQEIRRQRGLSQEELAETAGFESAVSISQLERGEHFPKKENWDRLCEALNIEAKDLFDFGHMKTRQELASELTSAINTLELKELQYFKKIFDAYFESR